MVMLLWEDAESMTVLSFFFTSQVEILLQGIILFY